MSWSCVFRDPGSPSRPEGVQLEMKTSAQMKPQSEGNEELTIVGLCRPGARHRRLALKVHCGCRRRVGDSVGVSSPLVPMATSRKWMEGAMFSPADVSLQHLREKGMVSEKGKAQRALSRPAKMDLDFS